MSIFRLPQYVSVLPVSLQYSHIVAARVPFYLNVSSLHYHIIKYIPPLIHLTASDCIAHLDVHE